MVFDAAGTLWQHEMGPMGGDELNIIKPGKNYGWPWASNGDNYDGSIIPDHKPGDGYEAPVISWTPAIAPAGMIYYTGAMFAPWRGNLIISGLQYHGLIRISLSGSGATEVQRIPLGERIREVEQAPDGAIWVLEDQPSGRLLRLVPAP
jgi:glucose/arabinose dehydrogenase